MQSIEEINALVTPETGWAVELGVAPHDHSEFLRLMRVTNTGEKVFLTSMPRDTGAGAICSFAGAARHYYNLGRTECAEICDEVANQLRLPAAYGATLSAEKIRISA